MTASQNVYDYLGKKSYNVLKLTTSSNGNLWNSSEAANKGQRVDTTWHIYGS